MSQKSIMFFIFSLGLQYDVAVAHEAVGNESIKTISAHKLHKRMQKEQNLKVINVLSLESFQNCRIVGSENIPLNDLESKVHGWDKNQKIVVHCGSYECPLSKVAYKKLTKMGFANVRAYEGGIKEWKQLELPTQGGCVMQGVGQEKN